MVAAAGERIAMPSTAARAQTGATFKQTETTFDLEQMRNASEVLSFHAMLEAAMARVLAKAAWPEGPIGLFRPRQQAYPTTASSFASASPRARSRNCAQLASGDAAI